MSVQLWDEIKRFFCDLLLKPCHKKQDPREARGRP